MPSDLVQLGRRRLRCCWQGFRARPLSAVPVAVHRRCRPLHGGCRARRRRQRPQAARSTTTARPPSGHARKATLAASAAHLLVVRRLITFHEPPSSVSSATNPRVLVVPFSTTVPESGAITSSWSNPQSSTTARSSPNSLTSGVDLERSTQNDALRLVLAEKVTRTSRASPAIWSARNSASGDGGSPASMKSVQLASYAATISASSASRGSSVPVVSSSAAVSVPPASHRRRRHRRSPRP